MNRYSQIDNQIPLGGYDFDHGNGEGDGGGVNDNRRGDGDGYGWEDGNGYGIDCGHGNGDGRGDSYDIHHGLFPLDGDNQIRQMVLAPGDTDLWVVWDSEQGLVR